MAFVSLAKDTAKYEFNAPVHLGAVSASFSPAGRSVVLHGYTNNEVLSLGIGRYYSQRKIDGNRNGVVANNDSLDFKLSSFAIVPGIQLAPADKFFGLRANMGFHFVTKENIPVSKLVSTYFGVFTRVGNTIDIDLGIRTNHFINEEDRYLNYANLAFGLRVNLFKVE